MIDERLKVFLFSSFNIIMKLVENQVHCIVCNLCPGNEQLFTRRSH